MDFETAKKIIEECINLQLCGVVFKDGVPRYSELGQYSLDDLIQANRIVSAYNQIRTDGCQHMVLDDRLIAAIFVLHHYTSSSSEPVIVDDKKAVVVIDLPDGYFGDQSFEP